MKETQTNKKELNMNKLKIKKLKKAMNLLNELIPNKSITKMSTVELQIRTLSGNALMILDGQNSENLIGNNYNKLKQRG